MDDQRDLKISGPPLNVQFSLVDQVAPPVYSRRILIFSREEDNYKNAVIALEAGIQRTVNEIPILAGQMGLTPTGWIVKDGHALLRIRDIGMSYSKLQSSNFSETMLQHAVLSSAPAITDAEDQWNVCRIQANFIRGGLLLVISINHTTMDGRGITMVIEALARNCRLGNSSPTSVKPVDFDRSRLKQWKGEADILKLSAYAIIPDVLKLHQVPADIVTKSFRLPVQALKALKVMASPKNGWVTTHDAVNALCWRIHARCRCKAKLLGEEDIGRFGFPVDFRKLIDPPLCSRYIGNAVLMTTVELPIRTLLSENGLSVAAATIRNGVKDIDSTYVENFIAVANSLDNPRQLKINLMLTDPHTGFGSTTYKGFEHSMLDWDPILGKYQRLRLPYGVLGEGMSVILPVLHDGSWEVTITLEKELEWLFESDEEWAKYVC
jgi:hypothetical protein